MSNIFSDNGLRDSAASTIRLLVSGIPSLSRDWIELFACCLLAS